MKNIFIKSITAIILLLCLRGNAQNDYLNLRKYWWYHYRLLNSFMAKGDCKGCSEPMNERNLNYRVGHPVSTVAKWGDQTISLGMYIGTLALEYRMLVDNGQPADTTIEELYYAIKAFNRLDETAENYFGSGSITTSDLNGFFLRDDVDTNFLSQHPKLINGVGVQRIVNSVNSDYIDPDKRTNEMSHDQVWHLFMGFALVSQLVDDVSYQGNRLNNKNTNTDIKQEAKDITDRIMSWISRSNWNIKNPVTGADVKRGSEAYELAYPAAEANCFIQSGNTNEDYSFPVYPIHTCSDYHDAICYADAIPWNELGKIPAGAVYTFSDEDYKVDVLASIGHSWYSSMAPTIPNPVAVIVGMFDPSNWLHPWQYITEIIDGTPILPTNVTTPELGFRAPLRDWQHLTLLHQVLHGGSNPVLQSTYKDLLNSAPCAGPYNFGYPDYSSSFEWSTDNRMLSPDRRGEWTHVTPYIDENGHLQQHNIGDDKIGGFYGEYNGLDYMIYYNLYTLINGTSGTPFVNYMDRKISAPFPTGTGATLSGDIMHPVTVEGFNSISADNIINADGDVSYRAGQTIHLAPGFHAVEGCNFHAYVDPFACGSDGDYRMAGAGADTSNTHNAVAYTGQTTFINYPKETKNYYNEQAANSVIQNLPGSDAPPLNTAVTNASDNFISIRPNPNNGTFQLFIQESDKVNAKVTLMNIFGNIIFRQQICNTQTLIDLSGEAKGIYYLKVENEKEINVQKIIYQ